MKVARTPPLATRSAELRPKFLSHASIIANRPGCHSALDVNVHRLEGDAARFAFGVTPGSISSCSFLRRACHIPSYSRIP
jgi:hypothetical protein